MIKHCCIVDTTYSLLLYLTKMSLRDISQTLFFVGNTIQESISSQLPHCIRLKNEDFMAKSPKNILKTWLKFRIGKNLCFPFLLFCDIYAQDHLSFSSQLLGFRRYTLIEDAPMAYSLAEKSSFMKPFIPNKGDNLKQRIKYHLNYGHIYGKIMGTNNQCVNRWLTKETDLTSVYIEGKNYTLINPYELWKKMPEDKKNFIKKVFGIIDELLVQCVGVDLIILTQPWGNDCKLTDDEILAIYKPYIERYNHVVIKPHPRDTFDWETHFPNHYIMRTQAPMQVLNIMGVRPKAAMTVTSTAISSMPDETEKIIVGSKVNAKILAVYGDIFNS